MKKKMAMIFLLVIAGLSSSLVSCKKNGDDGKKVSQTIVQARLEPVSRNLSFKGVIEPIATHSIIGVVPGRVQSLHFQYGDKIKKGQLLMVLNSKEMHKNFTDAIDNYLQKKASSAISNEDFQGTTMLYKSGVMSRSNYLSAKNTFDTGVLSYNQAKLQLIKIMKKVNIDPGVISRLKLDDETRIDQMFSQKFNAIEVNSTSSGVALFPIAKADQTDRDGVVNGGKLTVGSPVKEGQLLLSVGDLSGYHIDLKVNETQVNEIKPGMDVTVTGEAFPSITLHGKVDAVSSQANPSQGGALSMFNVSVSVKHVGSQYNKTIHVGMTCLLQMQIHSSPQVVVPIGAVIQSKDNRSKVIIVGSDQSRREVTVLTGASTPDGKVAILEGVKAGDRVVAND